MPGGVQDGLRARVRRAGPGAGRLICPWARSDTPGYATGGNKFDLTRWDSGYFKRLRDYVAEAGKRGVVVELVMFSVFYNKKFPLRTAAGRNRELRPEQSDRRR